MTRNSAHIGDSSHTEDQLHTSPTDHDDTPSSLNQHTLSEPSRWSVSFTDPQRPEQHKDQVQQLFHQVFGHTLSDQLWHWKYHDQGQAALVWQGKELVAHYGGMARAILYFDQPASAIQIGDVMVQQAHRGTLTRKGPFFLSCSAFLERYIGFDRPYLLGFGFPLTRALKVAQRQKLYAEVDQLVCHRWNALESRAEPWRQCRPLDLSCASDRQAADQLWQQMRADFSQNIIGVRDARYLTHRYLNRPEKQYELWMIRNRLTRTPLGIVVLSQNDDHCQLLDIIARESDFPALIRYARRLTHAVGHQRLDFWITRSQAHRIDSAQPEALGISIPSNIWQPGPSVEKLTDRWWLTAGDTDFC